MDLTLLEEARRLILPALVDFVGDEVRAIPYYTHDRALYHYTSAEGLQGILESGDLWATNVLYLNDSAELTDAIRILESVVEEESKQLPGLLGEMLRWIPGHVQDLPLDYFVVCFCQEDDLLSQWRAYGSRGAGYSIGFNMNALIGPTRSGRYHLRQVIYDPKRKKEHLQLRIYKMSRTLARMAPMIEPRNDTEIRLFNSFLKDVASQLTWGLAHMKHPTFAEEREWRIVLTQAALPEGSPRLPVKIRLSNGLLVPYVSMKWHEGDGQMIKSIRHGPVANPVLTQRAVSNLLAICGITGVEVLGSSVPLRA